MHTRSRSIRPTLRLLFATLVLALFSHAAIAEEPQPKVPFNPYYALTQSPQWFNTTRPLQEEDLRGRILLLDFWTYACVNCLHVLPDLAKLEQMFGKDLTVIGIHSGKFSNEGDQANVRQAVLRHHITHPVVNDADFRIWDAFGVRAWPTLLLLDSQGKLYRSYKGEGHLDSLTNDIKSLIRQRGAYLRRDLLPLTPETQKETATLLRYPSKVTPGRHNGEDVLFVADSGHHRVVVVSASGEIRDVIGSGMQGFADGDFTDAKFNAPQGLLYKADKLYIADTGGHRLRAADLKKRTVESLGGTGQRGDVTPSEPRRADKTPIASPWDLAFYPDEEHIVIAMSGIHQLWSYDVEARTLKVLAGSADENLKDGEATAAQLAQPSGLSAFGGALYFVDAETSSLRVLRDGKVQTLVGKGLFEFGHKNGGREDALMQHPLAVMADASGVYVADSYNHRLRRYEPASKKLTDFAGNGRQGTNDGNGNEAEFREPSGLTKWEGRLVVADTNNHAIRTISLPEGVVKTLAVHEKPQPVAASYNENLPNRLALEPLLLRMHTPVRLKVLMPQGWHINEDAPSYLALYDMYRGRSPVAVFDRDMIRQGRMLIPARFGTQYQLQGLLYYCEDKAGSQCLLKGVDVPVKFTVDGNDVGEIDVLKPTVEKTAGSR